MGSYKYKDRFHSYQSLFLAASVLVAGCTCNLNPPLQIESIILCDLWNEKGICLEPWEQNSREYKIPKKVFQNLKSNKNLMHYLYFQAKETPGILIHWNREPTKEEWNRETQETCKFRYTFRGTTEFFSGFEKGKTFMGFFQYLANILEPDLKRMGKWNHPPDLSDFKDLSLKFHRACIDSYWEQEVIIRISLE